MTKLIIQNNILTEFIVVYNGLANVVLG